MKKIKTINIIQQYKRIKLDIENEMRQTKEMMKKITSSSLIDELKCRKRVLRRLDYCTPEDVILIKGRVASEITGADELLLTEMLFDGFFNDLNVYQIAALLSCMVFEEKTEILPKLSEELSKPLKTMQEFAKNCNQKFRPNLMDVIYSWTKGKSFSEISKMTDAFEGSIIRCMRQIS
ncbi:Exosome RNA helicase MTR4 [Dermatophagoides farinae]|uniref:Exosome RNA helicase MTR4 n=1 Tax=Dermatophagoides farinae TaxID=6954 RepID=A0A922HW36_DERFA|nr:Exosome RNA helicase MTR4 [Dermatophagoides farinae]